MTPLRIAAVALEHLYDFGLVVGLLVVIFMLAPSRLRDPEPKFRKFFRSRRR